MTDLIDTVLGALPSTCRLIERNTGMARSTVLKYLSKLRKANWVYVGGWQVMSKKKPRPIYKIGNKPDVAYVKPTPAQYWASWCKNNPEGLALKLARERVRQRLKYRASSPHATYATGQFAAIYSNVDLRSIANAIHNPIKAQNRKREKK